MPGTVRVEHDGPIGYLVFDHPERRNAMTHQMWLAVPELCAELDHDASVRVVVLKGEGTTAFVAGADISGFEGDTGPGRRSSSGSGSSSGESRGYDGAFSGATTAIEELGKPVLAAIHGFCIGGGLALAAAADVRYASDDAVFGLPPARLGIGYGAAGIGKLVDLLGPSVTKEIIYTADWYDAQTALRWGLVNHVLAKDDLDAFVTEKATTMAGRAPLSQVAAKLAVADHLREADDRRPEEVRAAIGRCFVSADYREGVRAFMEKRSPRFEGR